MNMKKRKLLDLFCCSGGAAMGYLNAGFDEVVGVDKVMKKEYPGVFIKADIEDWLFEQPLEFFRSFDLIHASPPCQGHSITTRLAIAQGNIPSDEIHHMTYVRAFLKTVGVPYVIENVERAWPKEVRSSNTILCGSSFGLGVQRHRMFESSFNIERLPCNHNTESWPMGPNGKRKPIGVYGSLGDQVKGVDTKNPKRGQFFGGKVADTVEEAQKAMGITHITQWANLKEAIPPAYTEHIAKCFFEQEQSMLKPVVTIVKEDMEKLIKLMNESHSKPTTISNGQTKLDNWD
jgi:DNA (cytosine-5)-methyltransferase 1